jgi:hypothetical protein
MIQKETLAFYHNLQNVPKELHTKWMAFLSSHRLHHHHHHIIIIIIITITLADSSRPT